MTRISSSLFLALAMVGLGAFLFHQGYSMGIEHSSYARVGPHIFLYVVGAGLVIIGLLLARTALNGSWSVQWVEARDTGNDNTEFRGRIASVAFVAVGLVLNAALIAPLGFVVASTLMFAMTTRAFGSFRVLFDLAVGAAFSAAIFLSFTYLLGLPLPAGTIWSWR